MSLRMQGLAQNDLRHLLSRKPGGNQPPEGQPEQRPSLTSRLGTVTRSEPEPRAQAQRTERAGRTQHAQRRIEIDEQPRMTRQPSRHA